MPLSCPQTLRFIRIHRPCFKLFREWSHNWVNSIRPTTNSKASHYNETNALAFGYSVVRLKSKSVGEIMSPSPLPQPFDKKNKLWPLKMKRIFSFSIRLKWHIPQLRWCCWCCLTVLSQHRYDTFYAERGTTWTVTVDRWNTSKGGK